MVVCIVPFNKQERPLQYARRFIANVQLHCPDIGRNASDWSVLSVSALYGVSVAA